MALRYDSSNFEEITYLGDMNKTCPHCSSKNVNYEKKGICCNNGKTNIPQISETPVVKSLLEGTQQHSKHFLNNASEYNNVFAMTSFGVKSEITNGGHLQYAYEVRFII